MKLRLLFLILLTVLSAQWSHAQKKSPGETQNAALRYWMAFAEMQDPPADKTMQELLERTAAGQAAWEEARLGPILDSNSVALQTMQRATKLPGCDWGLEYGLGPRMPIPYLVRARVMARLNTLQAMREMAAGKSQAAVERLLAGVRFSTHLARGGSLISALTAKGALLSNLRMLILEAKSGRLTDAQTAQALAALKALPEDAFDWASAWEMEELGIEICFDELKNSKNARAAYLASTGEAMPEGAVVPSAADLHKFREYMAGVKAALRLSPDATKERLEMLETQKRTLNELIRQLVPAPKKVNESRVEVIAARKQLLELLAVKSR
jgi:hypothetical protein